MLNLGKVRLSKVKECPTKARNQRYNEVWYAKHMDVVKSNF